jgi:hypothetical protein
MSMPPATQVDQLLRAIERYPTNEAMVAG